MINQLIIIFVLFNHPSDTVLGTHIFSKCLREGLVNHQYYLREKDSLVLALQHAEQWESQVGVAGKWVDSGGQVKWIDQELNTKTYAVKKIRGLIFLVPLENMESVVKDLNNCIEKGWTENFQGALFEDNPDLVQRIYHDLAHRCTCERDVFVEVPPGVPNYEETEFKFTSYRRKVKKNKKSN